VYVADGYGNARVHRFSASGELEHSWGEPGTGPGQFHLVHHVALDLVHRRVVVCDRENDRIQVFSLDGNYITEWRDVHRPAAATITSDGLAIVAEIGWVVGDYSWMHGDITRRKPSRVSILDADSGKVLRRFGVGEYPKASVAFTCAHGVASNSHGDLFIAETPYSWARLAGGRRDEPPIEPECPTIQVLARVRPV
jgi:DNA-binding beta-propeller fold protein YncE